VEVATFFRDAGGTTLETVVSCGPDGLSAEHWLDGELFEPETGLFGPGLQAGLSFPWAFDTYHRVVAAADVDGVDYLFDGGWWIEDRESDSCAPHEPPDWDDYADGGQIVVTEILWKNADFRDIACPGLRPDAEEAGGAVTDTCTLDFDHVRRARVDGRLLEIGFDCGPSGVGEVWWVVDGTMVSNRYYHPPEGDVAADVEPSRAYYGDTSYEYVAHVQWLDSEVYVFDIGWVRIDHNLEAVLGWDNCALVDWSGPPVAFEGATPGQLVWQTGWMVDAGLLGPECAGYSTCRQEISYWEASGADIGLTFSLTSKPITPVVLDITWDPTEVSIGDAAGGCADTSQVDTSATLRVTIEPDDWPHQGGNMPPAGMLTFATSGAGDGIADGDQVTEIRVTVVDELSDPAYHDAEDLVLQVTTRDDPDGAICH